MERSEKSLELIRNAIRTPDGTILESRHGHDYREYEDDNGKTYMVDGGLSYIRRSNHGDEEDMCLYNDQPHNAQRWILKWGTYGKSGKKVQILIPIADMEDSHIEAVLSECWPSTVYKECMERELDRRNV